jgi:hypothetical protein
MNAVDRLERLLALKYDRDFYMMMNSWEEYIHSIGCSMSPIFAQRFEVEDPEGFGMLPLRKIYIPLEIGLKVLTLGGFP